MAPIMMLSGHDGEIYAAKFSPDGSCLASAGFDMKICLFRLFIASPAVFLLDALEYISFGKPFDIVGGSVAPRYVL